MNNSERADIIRNARVKNAYNHKIVQAFLDDQGDHSFILGDNAVYLQNDNSVTRLYWFLSSLDSVRGLFNRVIECSIMQPLISEIVYSGNVPDYISVFVKSGMKEYTHMSFMTRKAVPTEYARSPDVMYAQVSDVKEIYELLFDNFDICVSHLPSIPELERRVNGKEIRIVKIDGRIAALGIFERTGNNTMYLYQILTAPRYQKKGLSSDILEDAIAENGAHCVFTSWVQDGNLPSISLHQKHGFYQAGRKLIVLKGARA